MEIRTTGNGTAVRDRPGGLRTRKPLPAVSVLWMALAVSIGLGVTSSFAGDAQRTGIAVAHFYFLDTSGEVQDQRARHEKQLRQFETTLQKTLSEDSRLKPSALPCGSGPCTLDDPGADRLISRAREADARYLLAGGIHKMSTLIGWAKFTVFDLENAGRVCNRLLTYRGDTPEAWRRAAEFGAKDLIRACFH